MQHISTCINEYTRILTQSNVLENTLISTKLTVKQELRRNRFSKAGAVRQKNSLQWQLSASESYMAPFAEGDFCTSKILSWRRCITSSPMVPQWIKHEGNTGKVVGLGKHMQPLLPDLDFRHGEKFCLSANVFPSVLSAAFPISNFFSCGKHYKAMCRIMVRNHEK